MTLQSIPALVISVLVLYVGSYHLLLYFRRPQMRLHMYFGVMCLVLFSYDILTMIHLNQVDTSGTWLLLHFISLTSALGALATLQFVAEYTGCRIRWFILTYSLCYLPIILVAIFQPGEWLWTHEPLVKTISLPGDATVTYYENVVGPLWYVQALLNLTALSYAFWAGIQMYRSGRHREATPLLIALSIFSIGVLNDAAVNAGLYEFIYIIDYTYLALVLVMTLALSNETLRATEIAEILRESERRLAEANVKLQQVLDTIPVRVFWKDRNSVYLGCNSLFARDAGRQKPADLVGQDDFAMGWRNEAEMYRADDRSVIDSGVPRIHYEEPQTTPDGDQIWLRTSKIPLRNPEGEITGVLGTYEDITKRKQQEEALRQSQENLTITLNSIGDGVIATDGEGKVTRLNPVAEQLTGWSAEDARGRPLNEVFRVVDAITLEDVPSPAEKVLTTGILKSLDRGLVLVARDGSERYIADSAAPIRGANDEIVGVALVFRDVTEDRALQEQLRHSQKMEAIGQLAGGVAHDFNNLLQAILGYTETAMMTLPEGDTAHQDLLEVKQAASRAADLTRQLLAFGRRESLQRKYLDLNRVVANLSSMLRRVIGEHVELVVKAGPDLKSVYADPGQLEQVLVNLCINARDAMPDGGRLTIATRNVYFDQQDIQRHPWAEPGEYVLLGVTDTGIGMSGEIRGRIFEPFFTTKEVGVGTGLGLATGYAIIEQHGGMIEAESQKGEGSELCIYLPATSVDAREEVVPETEISLSGAGETILVVEDNEVVRELTVQILEKAGYQVLEARDGAEAIDLFNRHPDDVALAIVDVVMPRRGGREVHDIIKTERPDTPVLFHSGYSYEAVGKDQLPAGDYHLIQKPYQAKDLLRKVRTLLQERVT